MRNIMLASDRLYFFWTCLRVEESRHVDLLDMVKPRRMWFCRSRAGLVLSGFRSHGWFKTGLANPPLNEPTLYTIYEL